MSIAKPPGWLIQIAVTVAVVMLTIWAYENARADPPAADREWLIIKLVQEEPPHIRWTISSGVPDGYDIFACNWDGSVCHFYDEVSEPEIWLSFIKWYAAEQRLGVRPKLSVRAFRMRKDGLENGPYSELTDEGISVR